MTPHFLIYTPSLKNQRHIVYIYIPILQATNLLNYYTHPQNIEHSLILFSSYLLFLKSIPSCTYTSFGIIIFLLPFSFSLNVLFCCNASWSSSASTYNIFTSLFLSTFISGSTISILCILFITACLLISSIYVAFSPAFL